MTWIRYAFVLHLHGLQQPGKRKPPDFIRGFKWWWQEPELNRRHKDFQSSALPTELSCRPWGADKNKLPRQRQAAFQTICG
jgi:hypothetical protein